MNADQIACLKTLPKDKLIAEIVRLYDLHRSAVFFMEGFNPNLAVRFHELVNLNERLSKGIKNE